MWQTSNKEPEPENHSLIVYKTFGQKDKTILSKSSFGFSKQFKVPSVPWYFDSVEQRKTSEDDKGMLYLEKNSLSSFWTQSETVDLLTWKVSEIFKASFSERLSSLKVSKKSNIKYYQKTIMK